MPESRRSTKNASPTTPEGFPTSAPNPPAPGPEFNTDTALKLGGLIEAVDSLKRTVKEQGEKLIALNQEIHGYKTGFIWVKWLGGGVIAAVLWLFKTYWDLHQQPPAVH